MESNELKKLLEQQVQLLSEQSKKTKCVEQLCKLSAAMCHLIQVWNSLHSAL